MLLRGPFGKLGRHQILVGSPLCQLPGALQDILEQLEAAFLKYQVAFPSILIVIPCHDRSDRLQISLGELRLDDCGYFFRRVRLHIVHSLLQGICDALDDLRIFFDKALLCTVCRVGDISAVFAERCHNIAFSL